MDPLRHYAGYENVLDQFICYFTDRDVYRAAQVSQQWKKWMQNAPSLWKRLFAAQRWTLTKEMDPFVVYGKHRRMKYDLERLVHGMNSIAARQHRQEDGMSSQERKAKGILCHPTKLRCKSLKKVSKRNEIIAIVTDTDFSTRKIERVIVYFPNQHSVSKQVLYSAQGIREI